jgi:hypothetical protein
VPSAFQTIKSLLFGTIIGPAVMLLMAVALLYFLWGVIKYIKNGESSEARTDGAKHMFWGIVGLAIMLSAFAIAAFIYSSIISIGGSQGINGKPAPRPQILDPQNQGF